jgi:hypothetical protein
MGIFKRFAGRVVVLLLCTLGLGGCMATSFVAMAVERTSVAQGNCLTVGCASLEIAGYVYDQANEGAATPCRRLNTVARALSVRCGYDAGSLDPHDVAASGLPVCPLTLATRDARLWPVLPELAAKGASLAQCHEAPLAALAEADACPDFAAATPEVLVALRGLAETDPHAVQYDVVRLLSCPNARRVALDTVLDDWLAAGRLSPSRLGFSPFAALHPSALESPLSHHLEAAGHGVRAAFGSSPGRLPGGFDLALRTADLPALDWWLARMPDLANGVPSISGQRTAWLPLARVLTPAYLADPLRQPELVAFLIARGADPKHRLPYDPARDVVALARQYKSPSLALLEPSASIAAIATPDAAASDRLASAR